MKDLKLKCFTDCFLGELSRWWNWKKNLSHLGKLAEENQSAYATSCHALLRLGTSQGYTKEQVFDFCLSQQEKNDWMVRENVDMKLVKTEFFKV